MLLSYINPFLLGNENKDIIEMIGMVDEIDDINENDLEKEVHNWYVFLFLRHVSPNLFLNLLWVHLSIIFSDKSISDSNFFTVLRQASQFWHLFCIWRCEFTHILLFLIKVIYTCSNSTSTPFIDLG
jgi:hypothetical protein